MKHSHSLFWAKNCPLIVGYLLIISLLALLLTFYRFPKTVLFDLIRFSLPLLLIWLLLDYYFTRKKVSAINQNQSATPTTPVEAALMDHYRQQQRQQQQLSNQLHEQQQQQLEQVELYSHEIKNSLTSLLAAAENQPQVNSQQVRAAVTQANYHLNMLLSDERLSMAETDFSFEWIRLPSLIEQILKDNSASFIHQQLVPELRGLTGISVLTDRKWLRFCVYQLLSNAIKYSTPNSTITIEWQNNRLQIIDQGVGIASSDLPRIFDNGFSGHNGHRTTKSTGMGLFLVKKVTNQLNFSLTVTSQLGVGTTASLAFPATAVRQ
ncbi:ATP-binding protein [uncultured Limosilactobacillus sp.]|uniref:ATP-binding protein n=1 Tax=uncultured Limosilactobacillus sp. TaxID=2837629 RepID=UPI0025D59F22|nr:ATP-binding protein [uncultured Limosilactobacillus sp.]